MAEYNLYGKVQFEIKGRELTLNIFSSLDKSKTHFFVPFTDNTNEITTYGAGRYLDLDKSEISKEDSIILDFNKSYNPYCAFTYGYSCPRVPDSNDLDVEILAMKYDSDVYSGHK